MFFIGFWIIKGSSIQAEPFLIGKKKMCSEASKLLIEKRLYNPILQFILIVILTALLAYHV